MSQRRKSVLRPRAAFPGARVVLGLLAVFALATAVLGGALLQSVGRQGEWQRRCTALETELAAAGELLAQGSADAEAGARAQSAAELAQKELESVLAELAQRSSLCEALKQRADALSADNRALRGTVMLLRQRAQADGAELELLGEKLTQAEEELAGRDTLYKEASQQLSSALRRSAQSEADLRRTQERLTAVEEEYAGASALLRESEEAIRQAKQTALSYYHSAQNAREASAAVQEEKDALP